YPGSIEPAHSNPGQRYTRRPSRRRLRAFPRTRCLSRRVRSMVLEAVADRAECAWSERSAPPVAGRARFRITDLSTMSDPVLEALADSAEDLVVQATLVSATGSSSKKIGAKMIVGASGKLLGGVTIGGCVDAQVIEAGDALIAEGGRRLLDISLD